MELFKEQKIELIVSKDETRPFLCAPYLDVDNKRLVATDGHRLVALPVGDVDGDVSGHIPIEAIKAGRKTARKGEKFCLSASNGAVETVQPDGVTKITRGDRGTFPKWQRIVPSGKQHTLKIGINAKYLYEMAQAMGVENCVVEIAIDPDQPLDPIIVRGVHAKDDADPMGVLMPHRIK